MTYTTLLLAGIFLPLFPFSMLFNVVFKRVNPPLLRGLLLVVWPQIGITIISNSNMDIPVWIFTWAVLTALLYALRALSLRDIRLWTAFIGISTWSLLWILAGSGISQAQLGLYALGIGIPLLLMTYLCVGLERRFGAAYLGLYSGLAQSIPRFSGVLVAVVLAILATPLFPTFIAMLSMIIKTMPQSSLLATGIGIVWLLWSWSGASLLQGLIVGPQQKTAADLGVGYLWLYISTLAGLLVVGVYCMGALL